MRSSRLFVLVLLTLAACNSAGFVDAPNHGESNATGGDDEYGSDDGNQNIPTDLDAGDAGDAGDADAADARDD